MPKLTVVFLREGILTGPGLPVPGLRMTLTDHRQASAGRVTTGFPAPLLQPWTPQCESGKSQRREQRQRV